MWAPLDFATIAAAMTSPAGWIELGLIAACFAVIFAIFYGLERI